VSQLKLGWLAAYSITFGSWAVPCESNEQGQVVQARCTICDKQMQARSGTLIQHENGKAHKDKVGMIKMMLLSHVCIDDWTDRRWRS
jgi:hypothetical protein